jgi:predicted Zn-dependent protease
MRLTSLCFAVLLVAPGYARAETLSSKDHNFSIDLPNGWSETNAPAPPPAIFTVKNTRGQKSFIVIAAQIPDKERASVARDMATGAKKASREKGWKISSEKQTTLNGMIFETFKSETPDGITLMNWITSAGNEASSLQGISKIGDASSDPELQSIADSFRLISPLPTNTPGLDKGSVAYKVGRVFGCCLFPGVLIALIAGFIIWLVRRNKPKP